MELNDLKINITNALNTGSEKLKDSLSYITNLKNTGVDKLNTTVKDILALAPLIEVTGFLLTDISVDIGVPPSINLYFSQEKNVAPEVIEQMLKENSGKHLLKIIVKSLCKADEFQKGLKLTDYRFRGLSMKIGLSPDVSLKFTRIDNQAQAMVRRDDII